MTKTEYNNLQLNDEILVEINNRPYYILKVTAIEEHRVITQVTKTYTFNNIITYFIYPDGTLKHMKLLNKKAKKLYKPWG